MASVVCRWNGGLVAVLIQLPLFELQAGASPIDQIRVYLLAQNAGKLGFYWIVGPSQSFADSGSKNDRRFMTCLSCQIPSNFRDNVLAG